MNAGKKTGLKLDFLSHRKNYCWKKYNVQKRRYTFTAKWKKNYFHSAVSRKLTVQKYWIFENKYFVLKWIHYSNFNKTSYLPVPLIRRIVYWPYNDINDLYGWNVEGQLCLPGSIGNDNSTIPYFKPVRKKNLANSVNEALCNIFKIKTTIKDNPGESEGASSCLGAFAWEV